MTEEDDQSCRQGVNVNTHFKLEISKSLNFLQAMRWQMLLSKQNYNTVGELASKVGSEFARVHTGLPPFWQSNHFFLIEKKHSTLLTSFNLPPQFKSVKIEDSELTAFTIVVNIKADLTRQMAAWRVRLRRQAIIHGVISHITGGTRSFVSVS